MDAATIVLRSDDPRRSELLEAGWTVAARSWGACLDASTVDRPRLESLSRRAIALGSVRELTPADAEAILRLDASTGADYPGGIATAHIPLTLATATVSTHRRAFGSSATAT